MTRVTFKLTNTIARARAVEAVIGAPDGWRVELKADTRSLEQNSRLWPTLGEFAKQTDHNGRKLTDKQWRMVFLAQFWALKGAEMDLVLGLDGETLVAVNERSTSDLTLAEMSEFLELIYAEGAHRNVRFSDPTMAGYLAA